ncbi:MAG: tRNA uridine-5-carboxymethylaminomethyl(34) synthesis GTPase MnmE [Ignavibacteriales bacterium]
MDTDCIAAIATPAGEGGIAIIRISGDQAVSIVDGLFVSYSGMSLTDIASHTLNLGMFNDCDGDMIDEVLIGLMRGPRSYTGEDVVEVNCHGGKVAVRRCLEELIQAGARLAEPGEFTKRAFLNGKLDMAQAEAVIELIRARSEKALELSVKNLKGGLSRTIDGVEELLVITNSRLEASIDFPEEVGEPVWKEIEEFLESARNTLERLQAGGKRNRVYQEGIKVVLVGKPNVGKSSLLNALMRKDRAIVTEIPGTTRDVIEDYVTIQGVPVKLADTAGIRETADVIESIGVEKSREAVETADIIVFMLDAQTGFTEEDREVLRIVDKKKKIVIINKEDIPDKALDKETTEARFPGCIVVEVSAKYESGIEVLEKAIVESVLEGWEDQLNEAVMVNFRQEKLINAALDYINDALIGVRNQSPIDALAVDTWGAVECLEELTGKKIRENIMERIFHDFCIGK